MSWDNNTEKDERMALTLWPLMSLGIQGQCPQLSSCHLMVELLENFY